MNTPTSKQTRRLVFGLRYPRFLSDGSATASPHDFAPRVGLGLAAAGAAYAAYRLVVRPRNQHWGATPEERDRSLPGDEFVPNARYRTTRAISIDAPVDHVWSWLLQMGQDRGGFYSYESLERLVGAQIHNADEIHPEWQHLSVGDEVRLAPEGRFGDKAKLTVSFLEPRHAIVFGPPPPAKEGDGSWAFILEPESPDSTRMLVRTQGRTANVPPFFYMFDIIHFVMERKMMLGLKQRAEQFRRSTTA